VELAEAAGVHQSMVSEIETGENDSPTLTTLVAFSKALGIGVDKLVEGI
jgi:transcriptional regulator with XRE-family HTH domain